MKELDLAIRDEKLFIKRNGVAILVDFTGITPEAPPGALTACGISVLIKAQK